MGVRRNVGAVERALRLLLGLALIAGYLAWSDLPFNWLFWLGVVPLFGALTGFCPVYHLIGWNTRDPDDSAGLT